MQLKLWIGIQPAPIAMELFRYANEEHAHEGEPTWNWIGATASSCPRFLASPFDSSQISNMNFVDKIPRYVLKLVSLRLLQSVN